MTSRRLQPFPRLLLVICLASFASLALGTGPAKPSPFAFTEHLIADGYRYAFGLALADLDDDGDLDLTSADAVGNSLSWFENNGKGRFTRHYVRDNEPGWFERHEIGDVDGDGRPDIVVVKNKHGQIVWFRNPKTPTDPAAWTRHLLTDGLPGAYDVTLADFDGDGDLDVAASSWVKGNRLEWFENDGTPAEGTWKRRLIEGNLKETREVIAADIDGDRDPDLLATASSAHLLLWYENTGNSKTSGTGRFRRHVIDKQTRRPVHGQVVDLDRDGDLDVLMAFGSYSSADNPDTHHIAWYENVKGRFGKHAIGPRLANVSEAAAGDFDGDGDLDVVACTWGATTGQVVLLENPGDPRGRWKLHTLKKPWPKASGVLVGDLNGDRRPDIVGSAERGSNEVRCWINSSGPRQSLR